MTGLEVLGLVIVGVLCLGCAVAVRRARVTVTFDAWAHPRNANGQFRRLTLEEQVFAGLLFDLERFIDGIVEGVQRAKGS